MKFPTASSSLGIDLQKVNPKSTFQNFDQKAVTPSLSSWFFHFFALDQPQITPFSCPWFTFAALNQVTQVSCSKPMKNN